MENQTQLLTVPDAAKEKGVTEAAVYLAIKEKRLPHQREYGRLLVPAAALASWQPGTTRRRAGSALSEETKAKIAQAARDRWARRKAQEGQAAG